ncbi:unnamed protein product [Spirodela intermedia]|uniref:Tubby-like F-box protein n=1 Tax=Spirodela intermedia TaxID=51605 RepID=A0A7I8JUA8_SPIIN|nr:unnamed protein product [Spirodela intermedia]CAA6673042.1 unnamed protein product [Spirodela intermedia]
MAEEGEGARGLAEDEEERWSGMLPELLGEIIGRVDSSEEVWPMRKSIVSCACVCRRWREVTMGIVQSPLRSGRITFPSSLKQPGPREFPLQCFIKRNKKNSTFYLYLSLNQSFMDKGKFLLAARRIRHGAHTEYLISLDLDDLSQGSNAFVGKLRSDFWGTKFSIYDSQPPFSGAKASSSKASRRFTSKKISPHLPSGNFQIGQVSYKFNLLKSRGPRRMMCSLQCPLTREDLEEDQRSSEAKGGLTGASGSAVILRNKSPRWHDHLQCWCLNFHGRVTVASVKNFQLVEGTTSCQPRRGQVEKDTILQFGKVGDDLFTMDFRHPLSAFQAFAICLTSFGTKLACE